MTDLSQRLKSPFFTPSAGELPALWGRLCVANEDEAALILKALIRRGTDALAVGLGQNFLEDATGQVAEALGRIAVGVAKPQPVVDALLCRTHAALLAILQKTPEKSRSVRAAIRALGNFGDPVPGAPVALTETALLEFWRSDFGAKHRQSLVIALGKIGGSASLEFLEAEADAINAQLSVRAALQSALLLLRRRLQRGDHGVLLPDANLPGFAAVEVRFRCRAGLEQLVIAECPASWEATAGKQGEVLARVAGTMNDLFRVRSAESFGFPIRVTGATNSIEAVVLALTSPETRRFIKGLTQGKASYRIEWADDGARRAVTRDIATRLATAVPELINETRQPLWQIEVRRSVRAIDIELVPVGLADPRFPWRKNTVPASSHAPLAAALVRLAAIKSTDQVWDPFTGAGTELIECGLTTPVARLVGTDISPAALSAAKDNMAAAGLGQRPVPVIELHEGSCLQKIPTGITCIITNPPLGRRVERGFALELLSQFIPVASRALPPGGRMIWVTPDHQQTDKLLITNGFMVTSSVAVDMGGFHGHIQVLKKPSQSNS